MNITLFEVGPFQENTYLLEQNGDYILIDPGFYTETEYQAFRQDIGDSDLKAVLLTHAHIDHILGLSRVLKDYDVKVYLSDADTFLWENAHDQSKMFGLNIPAFDFKPEVIQDGNKLQIGSISLLPLYTPGHAPDHMVFYQEEEGFAIAGDALFKSSIGRTDLYKGDFQVLAESIREKLYTLPDSTVIYPGHGPSTSIADEKATNPFVKA